MNTRTVAFAALFAVATIALAEGVLPTAGPVSVAGTLGPVFQALTLSEPTMRLAEGLSAQPLIEISAADVGARDQLAELASWNADSKKPPKNGFSRDLPRPERASFLRSGLLSTPRQVGRSWQADTLDGKRIWGTSLRVSGADRLRVRLRGVNLPTSTRIWVWSDFSAPIQFGLELMDPEANIWSPSVEGETLYIEVEITSEDEPPGATFGFEVDRVLQLFSPLAVESAACLLDATCTTASTFPGITAAEGAIAHLEYIRDGGSYVCSGGLLNDTVASGFVPYLLTANHCISTQVVASSLEAFWDYRSSVCNGSWPNLGGLQRSSGATLLATSVQTDFTLVRLNTVPSGRWFLGWSTAAVGNGTPLHRVSHPFPNEFSAPAPQAYSRTQNVLSPFLTCPTDEDGRPWGNLSKFHYSTAAAGGTFGGSSGSPVMLATGHVVGQLLGGCGTNLDGCSSDHYTVDGAFRATYSSISQYLNPPPTGGPCVQNATTLCLLGNRFEVKATYTDYGNNTGSGQAVELTPDSGYFWFFDASNVEAVGKVVSFCSVNGSFGFYAGGLTDVGVVMTVRDTVANQTQTFTNNRGHNFDMISSAFNTCGQ